MRRRNSVLIEQEDLVIPAGIDSLAAFRRWAFSDAFPENGRIDYLAGTIEADFSLEKLHTHGLVKTEIAANLYGLIMKCDLGEVFIDEARVSSEAASLSVEPDIVVVLWESLRAGRVRYGPGYGRKGDSPYDTMEIEGGPDLVVEIVSDSSVGKDTRRLPRLYALAGVRELWLVDARREETRFAIHTLAEGTFREVEPDSRGRLASPLLGLSFRLLRHLTPVGTFRYQLEHGGS
jgi:Uma2 family endonuclease